MRHGKPGWLKTATLGSAEAANVRRILAGLRLNTVCREAACPNRGRCFESGTATFLLLGRTCTRDCAYCAISRAPAPLPPPEDDEPGRIARAVAELGIRYAVLTSVTRDDLPDGGAGFFARTTEEVRRITPGCLVEVLTPDFQGDPDALGTVAGSGPDVFNHNIETVRRLFPALRPGASYDRSLEVLRLYGSLSPGTPLKSGIMLGLGETREDLYRAMTDLRSAGVSILTMGQYLQPTKSACPVARFVEPAEFEDLRSAALEAGFSAVASGPLVRSSFEAALVRMQALQAAGGRSGG